MVILAVGGGVAFKNAREGISDNAGNESRETSIEASDSAKVSKQEDSTKEDTNKKEETAEESSTTTSGTTENTSSGGSFSDGVSTSQPPPTRGKTWTVTISSSGFSQSSITISAGDSVKWVNNDNRSHWPASNPHPQHTNYSGFDSFGISAGSSWSFKFNSKGTWDYHDHQFPNKSGTIIVN